MGLVALLGLLWHAPAMALPLASTAEARAPTFVTAVNIFGYDDREPVADGSMDDRELSAVGILSRDGRAEATAFLLGRHDLVVTTAHSFYARGAFKDGAYVFLPAGDSDAAIPIDEDAIVAVGTRHPRQEPWRDWAVVRLSRPVGTDYRPLDFVLPSAALVASRTPDVRLAAFHRDRIERDARAVRYISTGCGVEPKQAGDHFQNIDEIYLHDCDFDVISSGGPLLIRQGGGFKVFAINAGFFTPYRPARSSGPTAFERYDGRTNPNYGVRMEGDLADVLQRLLAERTS
ncbi:hypothetical protein [Marinivivus vitaminiproducens]|uniref:hypothetical protein n=1 Tax=Marinivivus vitaminiproducens TaxID=3035935 RepID=UPI0027A09551|nr:hypothetical protein P4R82_02765 [Geminicoccaceae bacterium SCSIO 64248]